MAFLIQVFNSNPIDDVDPDEVLAAITESNYVTLCAQYGLDPALIPATKAQLQVSDCAVTSGRTFLHSELWGRTTGGWWSFRIGKAIMLIG